MSLAGPRFSSGSALGPSHDGIRRMRRTNLQRRPCHKTYGRHQDSKRTRLIHRPAGTSLHRSAEFTFSPLVFLLCTTRCEIHERHCTDGRGALVCSVALSGQAPKPHSGAPQARGLTANAPTEQSSVLPRCAPPSDTPGHVAVASFLVCRFCCPPRDSRYRAAGLDARGQRGCDAARGVAS